MSLPETAAIRRSASRLGARISRYNLNVLQTAEGAELHDRRARADRRTPAGRHAHLPSTTRSRTASAASCTSASSAAPRTRCSTARSWCGQDAQRTNSSQSSRNLLLSDRAHVDTKPQLEIFADDVKCAHGATVGQLDAEEMFYLTSRGLSDAAARNLLTYAFGAEIIDRIPVASLKAC